MIPAKSIGRIHARSVHAVAQLGRRMEFAGAISRCRQRLVQNAFETFRLTIAEELEMDDRSEIAGRIGALAVSVDSRRWDELLDLFAPQVDVDYTSLFGGERQSLQREELIANWKKLVPGFTHTTHVIGTPAIAVAGDTAEASASVVAWHFIKEPAQEGNDVWIVGGIYSFKFAKLNGAWRIAALTLSRAWSDGNQDLPRRAGERAARSEPA